MLECANRPVARLELMKWCFLLLHETPFRGVKAFYRFLPYKLGPFSFCLYREVNALVEQGFIEELDGTYWRLIKNCQVTYDKSLQNLRNIIRKFVEKMKNKPLHKLVDYVYGNFPEFSMISNQKRLIKRPIAKSAIYTAGYEGHMIDSFLNMLMFNGIMRIIDVRSYPVSRCYGFHKSTLSKLCAKLGIAYVHFLKLGIKSKFRKNVHSVSGYRLLFNRYENEILKREFESIKQVSALMIEKPSVLMCLESDPNLCHRSILAKFISKRVKIPVINLEQNE